ncbi:MAG TPA: tetratricopeptide repeat protein, partial [Planctomycetes bacterium]|nr:tetratricopeptide repeat protein [Planctomycetota bacterium]
ALLVSALAVQGKYAQATKVLAQLSADPPDGLLAALESLAELSAGAAPAARTELARLQLEALRLLAAREHELTSPQRSTLSRIRAQALADVGRIDQALGAYEELVEANPQDLELQELYARLLASRSDRASLQAALERWRRIARQTPTATPRWFRAKYALAELHYRMGQSDTSQAIIRQLRVLHPELGGPSMKERFQELLQRCKTQRPR